MYAPTTDPQWEERSFLTNGARVTGHAQAREESTLMCDIPPHITYNHQFKMHQRPKCTD